MSKNLNRRDFFKMAAATLLAVSVAPLFKIGSALAASWDGFKAPPPADKKPADPTTGIAKVRGYVHKAKDYKGAPSPSMKKDWSKCANCFQFKATADQSTWAPCGVMPGVVVYEEGLCSMYMKNPKAT